MEHYGKENSYLVGLIMAMDNILALIMLPIFGALSDKTNSKLGKRMPFIIVGTILSLLAFPFIVLLFYYNTPVEADVAIDFNEGDSKLNTLMNPATNYDINNVNNSFVISKK